MPRWRAVHLAARTARPAHRRDLPLERGDGPRHPVRPFIRVERGVDVLEPRADRARVAAAANALGVPLPMVAA